MSLGLASTAESDRPLLRPALLHIPIADTRALHRSANVNPQRASTASTRRSVILRFRDESHDDRSRIPRLNLDVVLLRANCHGTRNNASTTGDACRTSDSANDHRRCPANRVMSGSRISFTIRADLPRATPLNLVKSFDPPIFLLIHLPNFSDVES